MITEQCVPVAPLMELTTGFWAFKTLATALSWICSLFCQTGEPLRPRCRVSSAYR
jgi:hypothetical protein